VCVYMCVCACVCVCVVNYVCRFSQRAGDLECVCVYVCVFVCGLWVCGLSLLHLLCACLID
jgi:hypothetical protein